MQKNHFLSLKKCKKYRKCPTLKILFLSWLRHFSTFREDDLFDQPQRNVLISLIFKPASTKWPVICRGWLKIFAAKGMHYNFWNLINFFLNWFEFYYAMWKPLCRGSFQTCGAQITNLLLQGEKVLFCRIFYQVNNIFLHQLYLKSPLPVKSTW